MKAALFCLALATALLWGYIIGSLEPRVYTERFVMQEICDYSATIQSGEWEEACGLAQEVAGARYEPSLIGKE